MTREETVLLIVVAVQVAYVAYAVYKLFRLRAAVPERSSLSVVGELDLSSSAPSTEEGEDGDLERNASDGEVFSEANVTTAHLSAKRPSEVFGNILRDLNKYAETNRGAASDFAIVKDAVDRPLDALIAKAEGRITTPLYLGLAGALFGIVVGVRSMASGIVGQGSGSAGTNTNSDTVQSMDGVIANLGDLLGSVSAAMIASLAGVVATIVLATLTRSFVGVLDDRRNEFFTFYQVNFIPKVTRDISSVLSSLNGSLSRFNDDFVVNVAAMQDNFRQNSEAVKRQAEVLKSIRELSVGEALDNTVRLYEGVAAATSKLDALVPFMDKTHANMQAIGQAAVDLSNTAGHVKGLRELTTNVESLARKSEEIQSYVGRHLEPLNIASNEAEGATSRILREFRENQERFKAEMGQLRSDLLKVVQEVHRATNKVVETAGEQLEGVPRHLEEMVGEKFSVEVVDAIRSSSEQAAASAGQASQELAQNRSLRKDVHKELKAQSAVVRAVLETQTEALKRVITAVDVLEGQSLQQSRALLHLSTPWYKRLFGGSNADTLNPKPSRNGKA